MSTMTDIKSVVFDFADDYGGGQIGIRSIEFYNGVSLISLASGTDFTYYVTNESAYMEGDNAFDTSLAKTGSYFNNNWASDWVDTNQRLVIVFDTVKTFDSIVVNNYHSSGTVTSRGAKGTKIYATTDTITSTTYGETVSNGILIFDDDLDEHVAYDVVDDQILTLIDVVYEIDSDVPLFSLAMDASAQIEEDIPALELEMLAVKEIRTSLPMVTFEGYSGSVVDATLPELTFESYIAGGISSNLPSLTLSCLIDNEWSDIIGTIPTFHLTAGLSDSLTIDAFDCVLPALDFSVAGNFYIAAILPQFSASLIGLIGYPGDLETTLPKLSVVAYSGAAFIDELPKLSLVTTGKTDILADLVASFQMPTFRMTGTSVDLFNITAALPKFSMTCTYVIVDFDEYTMIIHPPALTGTILRGSIVDVVGSVPLFKFRAEENPHYFNLVPVLPALSNDDEDITIFANLTTSFSIPTFSAILEDVYIEGTLPVGFNLNLEEIAYGDEDVFSLIPFTEFNMFSGANLNFNFPEVTIDIES